MKSASFDYIRPDTLDAVCSCLASYPDARIIAGGQSLVPMLAMRLARPSLVIDIAHIDGLSAIRDDNEELAQHVAGVPPLRDLHHLAPLHIIRQRAAKNAPTAIEKATESDEQGEKKQAQEVAKEDERSAEMHKYFGVRPGEDWGTLPPELQLLDGCAADRAFFMLRKYLAEAILMKGVAALEGRDRRAGELAARAVAPELALERGDRARAQARAVEVEELEQHGRRHPLVHDGPVFDGVKPFRREPLQRRGALCDREARGAHRDRHPLL